MRPTLNCHMKIHRRILKFRLVNIGALATPTRQVEDPR